jgi:hypothetical protein
MNEVHVWNTGNIYCHEKMKVHFSATLAIKMALRQVEWIVHGRIFLELLLHCKHVLYYLVLLVIWGLFFIILTETCVHIFNLMKL